VEDLIGYLDKEGYCPLGKMLQFPVQHTIWTWCLTDLETTDDILNIGGVI
jgi:hypothetical protein